MIKAIIVAEEEYCETRMFRDAQHLEDFRNGFACAAGHYGGGSFGIYTIDDLLNLEKDEKSVADMEVALLIRHYLS